ncbi:site-specific integrase [[Mycoplasma] testudinis]|uniref:site-specific integrase n=1 Tax=[Mycoplasma] testudinis TaxID=33924 RepID=UPI0004818D68|nr:site-specific integrase [[Mycoplasma] testudinis]
MELKDIDLKTEIDYYTKYLNENARNSAIYHLSKLLDKFKNLQELKNVDEIRAIAINKNKWNNNTKNLFLQIVKSFLNHISRKFSNVLGSYFNTKVPQFKKFNKIKSFRLAYSESDLQKIDICLNEFGNDKFKFLFNVQKENGLRIAEFCELNWNDFNEKNNYSITIVSKKGGNERPVAIPINLINDLKKYRDLKITRKTFLNLFGLFQKFAAEKYPEEFDPSYNPTSAKKIHFHGLRRTLITNMYYEWGYNVEEISRIIGHSSVLMVTKTYITTDPRVSIQLLTDYQKNNLETVVKRNDAEYVKLLQKKIRILEYVNTKLIKQAKEINQGGIYINELERISNHSNFARIETDKSNMKKLS